LSIRIDPKRKAVLLRAAEMRGETLSSFVLENAYRVAQELLADEGVVSINMKQLAPIFETFDHPPANHLVAIRKLLTERSILDESRSFLPIVPTSMNPVINDPLQRFLPIPLEPMN
jgi:uncharacterized protein (DUF1778 family)